MLDDLYPEIIDPQIHNERQRQHINILSLEKIAYIKKTDYQILFWGYQVSSVETRAKSV